MSEAGKDGGQPVSGEVIGRSIIKILAVMILLLPLMILLGFGLTASCLTGNVFDNLAAGPSGETFWGFLIGLFLLVAGPIWLASLVHRLLIRERLVLGRDRLQVLRRKGGRDVVLMQLPYSNIADIVYGADDFSRFLKINLKDPNDPSTFGADFAHNKAILGYHCTVGGGYRVSAATLLDMLNDKLQRQLEERYTEKCHLDQLLEKISTQGMTSLTAGDKLALKQFNEHFRRGKESKGNVLTILVYDMRFVTEVNSVGGGLHIGFRDGTVGLLDISNPDFELLCIHAEANRGRPVPVGVVLDVGGRIIDLNTAHDTSVQLIEECPDDPNRLKVAFWGYSPVCYLTRDHPEFERLRSTLTEAADTRTRVWVANHSQMVKSEPATEGGEFETWWKIMDVRPA